MMRAIVGQEPFSIRVIAKLGKLNAQYSSLVASLGLSDEEFLAECGSKFGQVDDSALQMFTTLVGVAYTYRAKWPKID